MRITDFDDAYQNAAYIPGAEDYPPAWSRKAAAFRAAHPPETVVYGPGPRQVCQLFLPAGAPDGLSVFIHGGYWHKFHPDAFSHLAAGALARGHAVALPAYTLAPDARISQITAEMVRAVSLLADRIAGPIRLCGHSAGGHLATRLCCAGALPAALAARVSHVLSISGVHDLRPLLNTTMNRTLCLTGAEAAAESPALLSPAEGLRLTAVVGARERPEFLRQTDLLANVWTGLGADCAALHLPGRHHFDVIEGLEAPDGPLAALL